MILVRDVFQAKYGMGDQLVQLFKEMFELMPDLTGKMRVMTDLSGPFFTIVTETEVEDLAAWDAASRAEFANPNFGAWFARMQEVVESGRREFYTIAIG